jgi:hypothetical protein
MYTHINAIHWPIAMPRKNVPKRSAKLSNTVISPKNQSNKILKTTLKVEPGGAVLLQTEYLINIVLLINGIQINDYNRKLFFILLSVCSPIDPLF